MKRTLDYDPIKKLGQRMHFQPDGSFFIETLQDVEDIVELNKAQMAQADERKRWSDSGAGEHLARIPLSILYSEPLKTILDNNDMKAFRKWLDDPANIAFRSRPGSLSK